MPEQEQAQMGNVASNVARHILTFFGTENDRFGMPVEHNSYAIFAGETAISGMSVAVVVPSPAGSPALTFYSTDGIASAIEQARQALRKLPGNQGLKEDFTS